MISDTNTTTMLPPPRRTIFETVSSDTIDTGDLISKTTLLLIIGNNGNNLQNDLDSNPFIHHIPNLFNSHSTPSEISHWTYATREEHPIHYIRSVLSLIPKTKLNSNNKKTVLSVILDDDNFHTVMTVTNLFMDVVIASMSLNAILSFTYERMKQISEARQVPFGDCLEIAMKQPSVDDIQKYVDWLLKMERDTIQSLHRGFRSPKVAFIDALDTDTVISAVLVNNGSGNKQNRNSFNYVLNKDVKRTRNQDAWELLEESCDSDAVFRLQFAFEENIINCRSSKISSSNGNRHTNGTDKSSISGSKNGSLQREQNGKVNREMNTDNDDDDDDGDVKEDVLWAILVHVSTGHVQRTMESTLMTIKSAFASDLPNSLSTLRVYTSVVTETEEKAMNQVRNSIHNAHQVIMKTIHLPSSPSTSICSAWDTLAKTAITDGCTHLLLSDGLVSLNSSNWPTQLQLTFDTDKAVCVGISHDDEEDTLATVALNVAHMRIFDSMFPSTLKDRGAEAFLQHVWDRCGRFTLLSSDKIQSSVHHDGISRRIEPSVNFGYKQLSGAISTLNNPATPFSVIPRIDVIVPTYRVNFPELKCILSLRLSTTLPCRVQFWIVVDNPSHPNVPELITTYDKRYLLNKNYYCRIIIHPHNLGASMARNTGLMKSNADFAILLDDDVTPEKDVLDAYLAAIMKHPNADILAGVTKLPHATAWWQQSLVVSTLPAFYDAAERVAEPPWPVTANACVRVKTNEGGRGVPLLFGTQFPKTGGGEDIEFGMRTRARGGKLVCVPEARVSHPWFEGSASGALIHVAKWMTGDSRITEGMSHTKTVFLSAPGWAEFIVIISLPVLLWFGLVPCIMGVFIMTGTELMVRTTGMLRRAFVFREVGGFIQAVRVAGFAACLQMTQDAVRVGCHLKRGRLDCLLRRLDLYDGLESTMPMQMRLAAKFFLFCVVFYKYSTYF